MSYAVNTSKTHRLPINFYWDLYALIPDLADIIACLEDGYEMNEQQMAVLNEVLEKLRRQRQSHRGMEEL